MGFFAAQPLKAIYVLFAIAIETIRFPLWVTKYCISSLRPNKNWTLRQAIGVRIVRIFLTHAAAIEMNVPLPLLPGPEKDQFVTISPAADKHYTGPMKLKTGTVRPTKIGGTWYPRAPSAAELKGKDVCIHFHGGAYVIGDGRKKDAGFAAETLIKHAKFPFVFAPQYRLSGGPTNAKFPAAFQDGLTSYLYVHQTLGVPTSNIVISGDSAGANLCLSLLRYFTNFGSKIDVAPPAAAFLWSPWVEPHGSSDQARTQAAPNYATDYIHSSFGAWGAEKYIPLSLRSPTAPNSEYISFLGNPFKVNTPLWISGGSAEVLFPDICTFYEQMKKENDVIHLDVQENAVHDYILIGKLVGFELAAKRAAGNAGEWSRRARKAAIANGKL